MISIIAQTEDAPSAYPAVTGMPTGIDADAVWQRIEAYITWRFAERQVEWIVEGCGEFVPPLRPATIDTTEVWTTGAYAAVTLDASPRGGVCLPGAGPYRITGTVGADIDVPAIVETAFLRLANYLVADPGKPGARAESIKTGTVELSVARDQAWAGRAMANSGAADLLRAYRGLP